VGKFRRYLVTIGFTLMGVPLSGLSANLPFGQVTTGTIGSAAQSNSYTFTANANDIVNFTMAATSGNLSPRLLLYNPSGTQVASAYSNSPYNCYGSGTVELNNVTLSTAGTYTAILSDCFDSGTGGYDIFLQRPNNPAGAVGLGFGGQPQSGMIGSIAQSSAYSFSASAKDVVNFTMVTTNGKLSPRLWLYSSSGSEVATIYSNAPYNCYGSGTVELDNVTIPSTGTYFAFLSDCFDSGTGTYDLFMQRANNPTGALSFAFGGQPQTGTIGSTAQANSYTFSANAKDILNFTMVTTSGSLSPRLWLYSSSGSEVATVYSNAPYNCYGGGTVELNNVTLPSTGTYFVFLSDCFDSGTGNYSISGQCFGVCTGPAAPPPVPTMCNYALAPIAQLITGAAGTGNIGVLTSAGCPWTASSNSTFLTIASGATGNGPGVVQFSASANTTPAARSGTLTIGGQTATVNQSGTAPLLLLTPSSISIQYRQQGPLPTPIPLSIYTGATTLSYTATASSTNNWLSVTPASGSAPTTLTVMVNPLQLSPGAYQGNVTVTAPTANPPSQAFSVNLTVLAAGSPTLALTATNLNYSFTQGSQQVQQQRILVGNAGGGILTYKAAASTTSGGNWLSVNQDAAGATPTAPDPLGISVDPSSLAVGTYTGAIAISADTTQTIPVTVTVSSAQQDILLSQTGLTFTAVVNGGAVPSQTFGVLNSGAGVMPWTVSTSTLNGGNGWLNATPNSGTTDAASLAVPLVSVSVNPANLTPGQYSGQIQVNSASANNSPQFVSVILNVLPAGSNPGPLVLPTGLIFAQAPGGPAAPPQTISISNLTGTQLTFNSGTLTNDGAAWFAATPKTGTVTPMQPTTLTVSVNSAELTPAIRQGVLTLLFQDGSVRTVNVLFLLASGGSASASARGGSHASGCAPSKLLPVITSLGSQFTVPAGWPNTVAAQVVDDCGNPQVTGTVTATFSNGDPPVPLVSLKNGGWTGTWQVSNTKNSAISVTLTADIASQQISGAATVSGSLQSSANAPVLRPGGVLNAASYSPSAPLAPGSEIAIFGSNLANGTSSASAFPLPSELAGTLVTIGGKAAPLLYAGTGQVNAIIPFGLPLNTTAQVIVQQGNAYTSPQSIVLSPANPAIYTADSSGSGQGIVFRPDGQLAQAGTPAQSGDELLIYASGLGDTTPEGSAGQAAPNSPLMNVSGAVNLTIGGQSARVDFAGLAPGFAGLYQINASVPGGVHGNALPVVLTVGGQPSPPVMMAVQ
jgi:uncharacterized protein (TIGR03437 family)